MNVEKIIIYIKKSACDKFGSFRQFCLKNNLDPSNFERTLINLLTKQESVNKLLKDLGFEIDLKKKESD